MISIRSSSSRRMVPTHRSAACLAMYSIASRSVGNVRCCIVPDWLIQVARHASPTAATCPSSPTRTSAGLQTWRRKFDRRSGVPLRVEKTRDRGSGVVPPTVRSLCAWSSRTRNPYGDDADTGARLWVGPHSHVVGRIDGACSVTSQVTAADDRFGIYRSLPSNAAGDGMDDQFGTHRSYGRPSRCARQAEPPSGGQCSPASMV
jgi:hypothetical protein